MHYIWEADTWTISIGSILLSFIGGMTFMMESQLAELARYCINMCRSCKIRPSHIFLLLAVARKNNQIEVLSPVNGDIQATISDASDLDSQSEENSTVGLHLFAKQISELASRDCTLLTCTTKGNASLRSIEFGHSSPGPSSIDSPKTWNVCSGGNILCCQVDGNEKFALFGGKGVEMNIWDLNNFTKIWNSKHPPKDNLGIFTPTWFTSATFLMKDDHHKFVAGTNSHQEKC